MAKFRKRPVVIEATQWFPGADVQGVCVCPNPPSRRYRDHRPPHVHTLEGDHLVSPGDWIVTGVKGERYPVKAEIFAATYEPVEEPQP